MVWGALVEQENRCGKEIDESPGARVMRLNPSEERVFLFLLAPGEISGQLKAEEQIRGRAELGNVLIRKTIVVVSSRQRARKTVPTLPKPGKPLNSIIYSWAGRQIHTVPRGCPCENEGLDSIWTLVRG
jgi:hypothetical protein